MQNNRFICVIYANCQGGHIAHLLRENPFFSADFDIFQHVNYNNEIPAQRLLQSADLFIYQPLSSKHGLGSTEHLMQNLPRKCLRISISYLTFDLYWPYSLPADPRNTPSSTHPFGPFPYGDKYILSRLEQGDPPSAIWKDYLLGHHLEQDYCPQSHANTYYTRQKDLDSRRDQQITDYIMDNYSSRKLFETPNHPSATLARFQAYDLIEKCGYSSIQSAEPLPFLSENQLPIHPAAAARLGLTFQADFSSIYQFWGDPFTISEYAAGYISYNPKLSEAKQEIASIFDDYHLNPVQQRTGEQKIVHLHIPKTAGSSFNEILYSQLGLEGNPLYDERRVLDQDELLRNPHIRDSPIIATHAYYCIAKWLLPDSRFICFLRSPIDRCISDFEHLRRQMHLPEFTWLKEAIGRMSPIEYFTSELGASFTNNLQTRLLGMQFDTEGYMSSVRRGDMHLVHVERMINDLRYISVSNKHLCQAIASLDEIGLVGFVEDFDSSVIRIVHDLGFQGPINTDYRMNSSPLQRSSIYDEPETIRAIRLGNKYDIALYDHVRSKMQSLPDT